MKGFNEFIGESELDPLAELPKLASIRDAELAKPRDPEESIRWFNGFKSFLLSQLQITQLSNIVEIAPGHSRFEDMLAQAEKDRYPWGRKKSLGHYFEYYTQPVRYVTMLAGDFGKDIEVFWISREEYEKKFSIGTELDSLTSFIGESVKDWEDFDATNIMSTEQCQLIEDTIGKNPEFISNRVHPEDFNMLDNMIEGTQLIKRISDTWAVANKYEIVPGFEVIRIRPTSSHDSDRWIVIKYSDLYDLNLANGNLDQWKLKSLFKDF